jgi:hypothetical protein
MAECAIIGSYGSRLQPSWATDKPKEEMSSPKRVTELEKEPQVAIVRGASAYMRRECLAGAEERGRSHKTKDQGNSAGQRTWRTW